MDKKWKQSKGLVIIYVGDGKGKTTAAVGAAVRALGHGWNVLCMQFMKEEKWPSGERDFFRSLMSGSADPLRRHASVSGKIGVLGGGALRVPDATATSPTGRGFPPPALADSSIDTSAIVGGGDAADPLSLPLGTIVVEVVGEGFVGIMGDRKEKEMHRAAAEKGYEKARAALSAGKYQLVVLDEILSAVDEGLLSEQQILDLMAKKPEDVTLLMTGHKFYPAIFAKADLVTEMKKVKHPFDEGFIAKKGIDY